MMGNSFPRLGRSVADGSTKRLCPRFCRMLARIPKDNPLTASLPNKQTRTASAAPGESYRLRVLLRFFPRAGAFAFGLAGAFDLDFPRVFFALFGPRKMRSGNSSLAARLNFRAARRALSFPPYIESLNILVTTSRPRRKWTWKPCVCFCARALESMRRMFGSESGFARFLMSFLPNEGNLD